MEIEYANAADKHRSKSFRNRASPIVDNFQMKTLFLMFLTLFVSCQEYFFRNEQECFHEHLISMDICPFRSAVTLYFHHRWCLEAGWTVVYSQWRHSLLWYFYFQVFTSGRYLITQTCLCNILQYFTAVKMIIFR